MVQCKEPNDVRKEIIIALEDWLSTSFQYEEFILLKLRVVVSELYKRNIKMTMLGDKGDRYRAEKLFYDQVYNASSQFFSVSTVLSIIKTKKFILQK